MKISYDQGGISGVSTLMYVGDDGLSPQGMSQTTKVLLAVGIGGAIWYFLKHRSRR